VETVVIDIQRHIGRAGILIIEGLLEIAVDPGAIIILGRQLGKRINLLPVERRELRQLHLGLAELDTGGDDAILGLLECEWGAVECELLELGGGTANDLDGGSGVDVADEVDDLAMALSGTDEVAGLEDDV
jgi:hypothetical protein